jgi:hypothetical protein
MIMANIFALSYSIAAGLINDRCDKAETSRGPIAVFFISVGLSQTSFVLATWLLAFKYFEVSWVVPLQYKQL